MAFRFSWEQPEKKDQPRQPQQLQSREERGVGALRGFLGETIEAPLRGLASLRAAGAATRGFGVAGIQALRGERKAARRTLREAERIGGRGIVNPLTGKRALPVSKPRETIGVGVEIASFGVGGGGVAQAGRALARRGLKQAARIGAREGGIAGGLAGLGIGLQEEDAGVKDVVKSTLTGAVGGTALGALAPVAGRAVTAPIKRLRARKAPVTRPEVKPEVTPKVTPSIQPSEVTTRVPHFNRTLQKNVYELETRPGFTREVQTRGGGRVVTNRETLEQAAQRGPLSEEEIIGFKQGDPINTVDVVRANQTVESEFYKLFKDFGEGKISTKEFNKQFPRFEKLFAGNQLMTAEPARATQIQRSFVNRGVEIMKGYKRIANGEIKTEGEKKILQDKVNGLIKDVENAGVKDTPAWRGIVEGIEEFATAAKLTSPLTQAINLVSTAINLATRGVIERPLAAMIGTVRRQTRPGELKFVFGTRSGWKGAVKKFANVMRDETQSEITKLSREFRPAIPGRAGRTIRMPFRVLSAVDEFWKTILKDSDIHTSAYQHAFQEGKRGNQLRNRIVELVENPTEEMLEKAKKTAREFTFQEEPGKIIGGFSNLLRKHVPGGKLVVPFIQTPSNIVKFQARRSAIGALSPKNWADLKGGGMQQNEALARLISGIGMSIGGLLIAQEGQITGATPRNPGERDKFFREGKKPYAIKVGDRWVSYQRFQPIGLYLLQAVALNEALERRDEENASQLFGAMASTVAKGISEMPFVEGVNSVMNAITEPERHGERFITSILTGFVPTVSRDIRKTVDPYVREAEGTFQAIQNMLPWWSQSLEPIVSAFGEPAKFGGEISPIERGFGKITAREDITPLEQALTEAQFTPGIPEATLQRGDQSKELQGQERTEYLQEMGQATEEAIQQAITKSSFAGLTLEAKQKVLKRVVDKSRDRVRNKWKAQVFSGTRTVNQTLEDFLQ